MTPLAPIILFVYNRPRHTKQTVEALQKNYLASESELYIYSDGPKNERSAEGVNKVRQYISTIDGFKSIDIIERNNNYGLANSVILGATEIMNKYGKAIVLEDDLISSTNFLGFMNGALNKYDENKEIFSVSGYSLPIQIPKDYTEQVYLSYRGSSWGWGTWRNRWEKADWEIKDKNIFIKNKLLQKSFNRGGSDLSKMLIAQINNKIDSWAIRFAYAAHKNNTLHLVPVISKIQNIGQDNSGTHSIKSNKYFVRLDAEETNIILPDKIELNSTIVKNIYSFFKKNILIRLYNKIILAFNEN